MLRYALAARRLRRFLSRASPPPAAAPLEERLEGWEERVRAFHRFFTVEAAGEETAHLSPLAAALG